MKKEFTVFLLLTFFGYLIVYGQTTTHYQWWNPEKNSFPVIEGQGWPKEVARFYDRFPARAEKSVRSAVWNLSRDAAGLMIRFRSNATDIVVRYTVTGGLGMPHMPSTGASGVDLYAINKNGQWEWSGGKYHFGDTIEYHFSSLPVEYVREYRLYLPLYNSVSWMEIGTPDSAKMAPLPVRTEKPIVIYGTSIAQGGCASRPGMAWTSILGRRLDRPVINLAFSGNGKLELPVASLVNELDAKIFVLDCFPNLTGDPRDTVINRLKTTVKTLQQKHSGIPILIVEDADGSIKSLNKERENAFSGVNEAAHAAFEEMKAAGVNDIYYLTADQIGLDIESTVDGVHPNDAGMERYAAGYEKAIRNILHEPTGPYTTMQPCIQYRDGSYDWDARHSQLLKMNQTDPPAIVFMGNSITHYWGGLPKAPIARGADSWKKYFDPVGIRNFGYGWDRVENVLWRVYHDELDGFQAKEIIMMIGTNNIGFNSDKEIIAGLRLLVRAIRERQPGAKILLLGIYPRRDQEKRVAVLNEQIAQLTGSENIGYANPGVLLLDSSGKIKESLFVDGLHPNAAGYLILAKALNPYLISGSQ